MVEGSGLAPGAIVPVRTTGAGAYDLFGRVESPSAGTFPILP